jgi:hypothetical protein
MLSALLGTIVSVAPVAGFTPTPIHPHGAPTAADTTDESPEHVRRVSGATLVFPLPDRLDRPLVVLDDRLADRVADMARRSRKWREALDIIRRKRFPVLVGDVVQVERMLPGLDSYAFDGPAAAWIFSDERGRPVAAAVTVNLPMLVIRSRVLGDEGTRLHRMLDLHLVHEIYGHLAPIVATGNADHPCSLDPSPAAAAAEQRQSCVMRRECELLLELGYEPRDTYLWDYWKERVEHTRPGGVEGCGPSGGQVAGAPPSQ